MLKYAIVLAIAAASAEASVANMGLRGGAPATWSKLNSGAATLTEGYGTTSKIEVTHGSDLNGESTLKSTFIRDSANKITSFFNAKTKYQGVNLEANLDGSGTIVGEASYDEIAPGAKLIVSGKLEGGKAVKDMSAPRIATEYRKDNMVVTAAVEGSKLAAGAVMEAGDMQFGASTTYDSNDGSMGDPSFAARYRGGNYAVTAVCKGLKGDDVSATYTQTVSDELDVAGTFSTNGNKFSVGAKYKLDDDASVRGKINNDGILNVGYERKVSDNTVFNAGLEVDTNDMDSRKFGLSLKCT
mmetsp:Transcript_12274/g.30029  ORF Transcript_12274/g.30029 Transcript_12274/m.30029 type:complete len:299 (-) Transcript_12274:180-1076(-)